MHARSALDRSFPGLSARAYPDQFSLLSPSFLLAVLHENVISTTVCERASPSTNCCWANSISALPTVQASKAYPSHSTWDNKRRSLSSLTPSLLSLFLSLSPQPQKPILSIIWRLIDNTASLSFPERLEHRILLA